WPGAAGETPPGVAPGGAVAAGRRLHPAVMGLWPLGQVGPILLLLLAGPLAPVVAITLLLASAAASVVRYLRFSWKVADGALVIEQGLLQRQRRVIPLERVQSVDLVRKVRHRLLGVVEVRVEAVGGDSTEGRLDALSVADGQRLRDMLLRERDRAAGQPVDAPAAATAHAGAPARPLARLGPDRLVVAGLTGGRVGVAAALLGFAQQIFGERVDELLQRAPALLGARGIVAVVLITLVGAFVLSIVATVVAYWNFTLTREGSNLRIHRGLLEQRSDTLPLRRVQAVRVEENIVRRLLGLAAVKVDVAGRSGGEGRDTGTLLPLGRRSEAFALVARVLDTESLARVELAGMPLRARNRRVVRALVPVAVLTVAAFVAFHAVGLLALLLAVPAVAVALGSYRALGHAQLDDFVVARSGLLVRRTAFVPTARLQSLALTANPVQRWRRLATLDLQIARSPGVWSGPQLIDLDAGTGHDLLGELAAIVVSGRAGLPPALTGRG
ncbi:MAG TPA: PH domain-containing protein, partial [Egibacteraceae bacterium]|nr:PH domain-containing protein [Egibacteraceae bacterium]